MFFALLPGLRELAAAVLLGRRVALAVANMPQNKQEADALRQALDVLNSKVEERSTGEYNTLDKAADPVSRLKGLLAKMDVFRPGGLDILS